MKAVPVPSDHLLRTLAAVAPQSRILILGPDAEGHLESLGLLGFELYAAADDGAVVARLQERVTSLAGHPAAGRVAKVSDADAEPFGGVRFDWVVAVGFLNPGGVPEGTARLLGWTRRRLKDGGWVYMGVPAQNFSERSLTETMQAAGFALSEEPRRAGDRLEGIYRRVDAHTPR